MLVDGFGRVATDLRVSLTDRCNLRCTYCMPPEGLDWLPKPELLTDEEVIRLVRIGVRRLGITEVRTPAAVCAVRGTDFSMETRADGLHVAVYEGVVTVTPISGGAAVQINAGQQRDYVTGKGFGPVQLLPAAPPGKESSADAAPH